MFPRREPTGHPEGGGPVAWALSGSPGLPPVTSQSRPSSAIAMIIAAAAGSGRRCCQDWLRLL